MNAGRRAEELGLPGITNAVEDIITARDIFLARETGAQLHLCHCSTKDSVRMIAAAKADEKVARFIEKTGGNIIKTIVVKNKLVNLIVK